MVKVEMRTEVEVPQYFRQTNGRCVAMSNDGQSLRYVYTYGGVGSVSSDTLKKTDLEGIVEISREEHNAAVMEYVNREIIVDEYGF